MAALFVLLVVGPAVAWFIDRYSGGDPPFIGQGASWGNQTPRAVILLVRRGRVLGQALALASVGGALVVAGQPPLRTEHDEPLDLIGWLLVIGSVVALVGLAYRSRIEFRPDGILKVSLFGKTFVPWSVVREVDATIGQTRRPTMTLRIQPDGAEFSGLPGLFSHRSRTGDDRLLFGLGGLSVPEENVLGAVERLRTDAGLRSSLGSTGSLQLVEAASIPRLFGFQDTDAEWARRLLLRITLAYPIVAVIAFAGLSVTKALAESQDFNLPTSMILAGLLSPLLFADPDTSLLGCRRTAEFTLLYLAVQIASFGLTALVIEIAGPH